jgi:hypothetical protein
MRWIRRSGSFFRQLAMSLSNAGSVFGTIALAGVGSFSRTAESVASVVSP